MYEDEDLQEIHEDIIELNEDISTLRRDLDNISASVEGTGENVTLNGTAEARFKKPPLPMGNSEQVSYEGYNIININNQVNKIDSGVEITADAEKQIIKFNGTMGNTYCTSAKLALSEPLSTGVFRANFNSKCDAFIVFRASDDTWLKSIQSSNNSAIDISTLSKPVTHIQFGIEHLTSGTNVNYEVGYQLTEGNELKPYEPYVGGTASPNPDYPQEITNVTGDVEVVVENKNLFDKANATVLYSNTSSTIEHINNGIKVIAGQTSDSAFVTTKVCDIENLINKTVTVKGNWTGSNSGTILIGYCNKDGSNRVTLGQITTSINFTSITIPEGKEDKVLILWLYTGGNINGYVDYTNVQVEYGSTATEYVEHKEQTFTFPLGNEKLMLGDYLADDGIHHVRGQIVLKGTEWIGVLTEEGKNQFYLELSSGQYAIDRLNENNSLCNFYTSVPRNDVMISNNQIAVNNRYIRIRDDRYQTGNDLRLWIKSQYDNEMPVIIEYILKEEVIVPYTSAQQEVYNQIKEAISYDEQTNVSSNTIALFNVKAFKNMNTSIESLQSRIELLKGRS